MSGTSLDGLDVAFCHFERTQKKWQYQIIKAVTLKYPELWKQKLSAASGLTALDFSFLHTEYGNYIGKIVKNFVTQHNFRPDFVCSHGHTVFHRPDKMLTVQIGSGAAIAVRSGLTTVCDFRATDVAYGGQGAPLVPIGDELLFSNFDICLNIGGFANLSYKNKNERIAFDLCPANIILNHLARKINKDYDAGGRIAKKGCLINYLLDKLNHLEYYRRDQPKSLGREWLESDFLPLVESYSDYPVKDLMCTVTHHIAEQISDNINKIQARNVLVTGGGAYNSFLTGLIRKRCRAEIVLPEKELIDYKEALIFAFLGILRMNHENNCLKSVTGAVKNNCGGAVYFP